MLAAKPKTKRLLETIQLTLTFMSVCAVLETTRVDASPEPAGYRTSIPLRSESQGDRRFGDLARAERKRHESALREALEHR